MREKLRHEESLKKPPKLLIGVPEGREKKEQTVEEIEENFKELRKDKSGIWELIYKGVRIRLAFVFFFFDDDIG